MLAEIAGHPQARSHPHAHLDEVLADLAECRANLGALDGAIEALEGAIAEGLVSVPDPRCTPGEYPQRAGRRDQPGFRS